MLATPLSLTARTLYAELREMALAIGITEPVGKVPGSVVRKTVKGQEYLYYQYRDLGGRTRQTYLGPNDDAITALINLQAERIQQQGPDLTHLNELRAAFIGAGGQVMEHTPLKILKAFADAGALQPGQGYAVLIGTHAFNVLGNLLGVRWASQMQTQDIDLAGDASITLAINQPSVSVSDILEKLSMGFIPVPTLDPHSPSTSFRVRGKELRVDLLTPETGKAKGNPVFVPALNSMAQPVRFLDYLLADIIPLAAIGRRELVLINVPSPERFALHKLLVSESRPSVFANKAEKDRLQAMQILEVLIEEAPDGIKEAKDDLESRGKGWADKLARALQKCGKHHPAIVKTLKTGIIY